MSNALKIQHEFFKNTFAKKSRTINGAGPISERTQHFIQASQFANNNLHFATYCNDN